MSPLPLTATPREIAQTVKSEWALAGGAPDARAALERHPELGGDPSAVLDLAYEEFFLRRQAGEEIDVDEFCDRFPGHRSSLRRVLAADAALLLCPSALGADALSPEPAAWPQAGERVGDFTLLRELGRGSFARVYLATEASAGARPVAVKLSRAGGEAMLQGRLHHDNIVPVLWAGQDRVTGLHLVCMPYLGSATLTHVLDRAFPTAATPPLTGAVITEAIAACAWADDPAPDQVLRGPALAGLSYPLAVAALGAQLADGLAFLSERQLAHCDVKPSNVLLTPGGRPLLLDFNLARGERNAQGLFGGTFAYMAPEAIEAWVARRPLAPADAARADLFSLGAVLYELLTGRPPAGAPPRGTADEMAGWALKNLQLPVVPLRERSPRTPAWLARAVERCLALAPGDRPSGAKAVALALRRGVSPWRRRLVGLAAAAALLGGGALAGAALSAQPSAVPAGTTSPEPAAPAKADAPRAEGRRQLAAGWHALSLGQGEKAAQALQAADEAFQGAIDIEKRPGGGGQGWWEDYLGRGRALMLRGETVEAIHALGRARELRVKQLATAKEDPRLLACRAYCHAARGQHDVAIELYQKAMTAGLRTAAVRNNLAYSLARRRQQDDAYRLAQEALRLEPGLRPALLNRAEIAFARHMRQRGPEGQPLALWVVADLDRVIGTTPGRPGPASVYHLAARASALVLNDAAYPFPPAERERRQARLRELVVGACSLGVPHLALCNDDDLKSALGDWLVPNNLPTARPAAEPGASAYLVDPLGSPLG